MIRERFLSATSLLNRLLTVDGDGSGLDADKIDGLDSAAIRPLPPGMLDGLYHVPPGAFALLAATPWVTGINYVPIFVRVAKTFDRIGTEVTTAATAGTLARLGLYSDTGDGFPGNLIVDAGGVAVDSTGVKEAVINVTLDPGWYWMAVNYGATLQVRVAQNLAFLVGLGATSGSNYTLITASVSYGALPATAAASPTTTARGAFSPLLWLRKA